MKELPKYDNGQRSSDFMELVFRNFPNTFFRMKDFLQMGMSDANIHSGVNQLINRGIIKRTRITNYSLYILNKDREKEFHDIS